MIVIQSVIAFLSRFATQLLVALLMFAPALKKRKYFAARLIVYVMLFSLLPYAVAGFDTSKLYGFEPLKFGWVNLNWLVLFIVAMIGFYCCFDVSVSDTLFFGTAAYAIQHIARNAGTMLTTAFALESRSLLFYLTIFLTSLPFYALFWFVLVRRIKKGDVIGVGNKYIILLSVVTMFVVTGLSVYVMAGEEQSYYSSKIFAIICCALLLVIQFGLFERSKEKRERDEIEKMLHNEQELRKTSKENIDLINIKCHDLKHQITAIRAMSSHAQMEEGLREIENAILIYDSVAKTGNEALDLILTEKSLYCERHNVKISYIVDAEKLSMIGELDLYSLFGNAIDNAVESVINVADEEKRIISLNVGTAGDLLSIHIDNYVETSPVFEDGLPVTTKESREYHGYGVKSIKYIAEKYGGHASMSIDDNIFNLDIIFPIK